MDKPTIVITGASGLIGKAICAELFLDYQLVGLDIEPEGEGTGLESIQCDLTDRTSVAHALASIRRKYGETLASVIHLAAYYDFSGKPSSLYEKLTVEGTRRLLEELQSFKVMQFVFSSTLLVMKPVEENAVITETSPQRAEWDYPDSKSRAEQVIHEERGKIPTVILRVAGVYDEDCHSIPIAQQIRRIYEKRLEGYVFPGNPKHGQPFVFLDDLASCFRKVVECRGKLADEEVFLIAEPDVLSYEDLQDRLGLLIHGKEWPTIRVPKPVAKAGAWLKDKTGIAEDEFIKPWMVDLADDHYPVAIDRAREKLDWQPRRRLQDFLEVIVGRMQLNPAEWYQTNNLPMPRDIQESSERSRGARP